ncbi:MAG: hypothetical protein ACYTFY_09980, partial [Planctomycetota bacterium]
EFSIKGGYNGVRKSGKNAWDFYMPVNVPSYRPNKYMPEEIQKEWLAAANRLRLYEDGVQLGPRPYPRSHLGLFSRLGWCNRLSACVVFVTPDGTSPFENGREYKLVYTNEKDEKWQDTPSFEEVLLNKQFQKLGDRYLVRSKKPYPKKVSTHPELEENKKKYQAALERHTVTEDGKALPHLSKGKGWGWERWQCAIIIVPEDKSDPKVNGRTYKLNYKSSEQ